MAFDFATFDAQANLGFVVSQTAHIEPQVYRHRYPDIDYASLIPVDMSANPFAKTVTYWSMDRRGQAQWINGNSQDIPTADIDMAKHETTVYTAAIGYAYGWEEVGQAQMLGIALEAEKAFAARRAYEEHVYRVAFEGDTEKSFEGLFDHSAVPEATVAADGTGSSPLWSTKTAAQKMRDVNALLTGVYTATNTVAMADTLLLPYTAFHDIASTQLSSGSDMTVLEFIRRNNVYTATTGQPLTIRAMRGLENPEGASPAVRRMVAYRRAPDVLKLHIPMAHRFLPVQIEGLLYKVPGVYRLGGLDIRLPNEVRYANGL